MTKKNEHVDEGVMSALGNAAEWAGRQVAKTGIAGSGARQWATEKGAYIKARDSFVRKLNQALDSGIDSGTITYAKSPTQKNQPQQAKPQQGQTQTQQSKPQPGQTQTQQAKPTQPQTTTQTNVQQPPTFKESVDVVDRYLNSLSSYMDNILVESKIIKEATMSDFVKRFIMSNGAGYDWASHQSDLDAVADKFEKDYANSTFFPTDSANKLFDFLYSVGSQTQRDQYGNIQKAKQQTGNKDQDPNQDPNQETPVTPDDPRHTKEVEQVEQFIRQNLPRLGNPTVLMEVLMQLFRLLFLINPGQAQATAGNLFSDTIKHFKEKAEKAKQEKEQKAQQDQATKPTNPTATPQAKTAAAESKKLRKKSV